MMQNRTISVNMEQVIEVQKHAYTRPERKIIDRRTSVAAPPSSLYPSASKISWIAVKSVFKQASPSGDRGIVSPSDDIPINT